MAAYVITTAGAMSHAMCFTTRSGDERHLEPLAAVGDIFCGDCSSDVDQDIETATFPADDYEACLRAYRQIVADCGQSGNSASGVRQSRCPSPNALSWPHVGKLDAISSSVWNGGSGGR
jgi:hypothetical protein